MIIPGRATSSSASLKQGMEARGRWQKALLAALLALPLLGGLVWLGVHGAAPPVDPRAAEALLREGMEHRAKGNLRAAAEALRRLVAMAPRWAEPRRQLGAVYLDAREYDLARRQLEEVVRLEPASAPGWGQLGKLYLTTGQLAEAETALRRAMALAPDRASYPAMLGEVYRLRGDPQSAEKAIAAFRQALSLDPNNADAFHRLGLLYQRLGRLDEAAVALGAATRAAPDEPQPYFALAQVERQRGNAEAAAEASRTFRRLERQRRTAGEQEAAKTTGGPRPAIADDQASLDLETARLLEQGRRAFFQESEPERAIELLRQGLERAPRNPDLLYNLGLVLHFVGRLDEAEEAFRQALSANPKNPRYHAWIGTILLARGPAELDAAIAVLKESVRLGPNYAYGHYQLGRAYLLKNQAAAAAPMLERAVARNPRYREAYYSLGQAYLRLGKREAAQRALARFRKLDAFERQRRHLSVLARAAPDDPEPRLRLARFLAENGEREAAIRTLETMTRVFPDYAPAREELARLQKR